MRKYIFRFIKKKFIFGKTIKRTDMTVEKLV